MNLAGQHWCNYENHTLRLVDAQILDSYMIPTVCPFVNVKKQVAVSSSANIGLLENLGCTMPEKGSRFSAHGLYNPESGQAQRRKT